MKKIFSLAVMAMMVMGTAMMFTSCSSNDDPDPVDDEVYIGESITLSGSEEGMDAAVSQLQSYLQSHVAGSLGTVTITKGTSVFGTPTYMLANRVKQSNLAALQAAYKKVSTTDLDNLFKAIKGVTHADILLHVGDENNLVLNYVYQQSIDYIFATWKYTSTEGTAYALTIANNEVDDDEYSATLNVAGTEYVGTATFLNNVAYFESTEKMENSKSAVYEVGLTFTAGVQDSASGTIYHNNERVAKDVTFAK